MGVPAWSLGAACTEGRHEKWAWHRLKILWGRGRQRTQAPRHAGTLGDAGGETGATQEGSVGEAEKQHEPSEAVGGHKGDGAEGGIMPPPEKVGVEPHPVREGSGSSPASHPDTAPSGQAPAGPTPPG